MEFLKNLFKGNCKNIIRKYELIYDNYIILDIIHNDDDEFLKVYKLRGESGHFENFEKGVMKKINDKDYEFIIPCKYEFINEIKFLNNTMIFVCCFSFLSNDTIYDANGNIIKEYNYIYKLKEPYYQIGKTDCNIKKYGIMNNKMEILIPMKYDIIKDVKEKLKVCVVENRNEGIGVLNIETNEILVPMNKEYNYISLNNKLDYVSIVSYNGCASIYDVKKQKLVVPFKYDSVDLFNKKDEIYITELKNSKNDSNEKFSTYGFYDSNNNKEICDNRYLFIGRREHLETGDYAIVKLYNHKYGLIDNKGKEVIPCLYDDIYVINKSLLHLRVYMKDYYVKVKDFNKIYESKYIEIIDAIKILSIYFYTDKYIFNLDSFKGTRDEFIEYINQNYPVSSQIYIDCMKVLDNYKELNYNSL